VIRYGLSRWAWVNLVCPILRRAKITCSRVESVLEVFQGEGARLIERKIRIFPEVGPGLE